MKPAETKKQNFLFFFLSVLMPPLFRVNAFQGENAGARAKSRLFVKIRVAVIRGALEIMKFLYLAMRARVSV